jgi:prepilin-type N-terminal cleavage/methylation domain-containing protein
MTRERGFTLIEMLVVIAIIAIIGTMSTQIILSVIRSSNKTNIQNEVRQNGAFVIDYLERDIRSATDATLTNATTLNLFQPDGVTIQYVCTLGNASSNGNITRLGQELLNDDPSGGVRVQSCTFSLQPTSPIVITVDFTLNQPHGSPNRSDVTVTQNFRTTVSLRTY